MPTECYKPRANKNYAPEHVNNRSHCNFSRHDENRSCSFDGVAKYKVSAHREEKSYGGASSLIGSQRSSGSLLVEILRSYRVTNQSLTRSLSEVSYQGSDYAKIVDGDDPTSNNATTTESNLS